MDRRNPDCRDATNPCHPWSLGSGDPCRNDEFFLKLMAMTLEHGNDGLSLQFNWLELLLFQARRPFRPRVNL